MDYYYQSTSQWINNTTNQPVTTAHIYIYRVGFINILSIMTDSYDPRPHINTCRLKLVIPNIPDYFLPSSDLKVSIGHDCIIDRNHVTTNMDSNLHLVDHNLELESDVAYYLTESETILPIHVQYFNNQLVPDQSQGQDQCLHGPICQNIAPRFFQANRDSSNILEISSISPGTILPWSTITENTSLTNPWTLSEDGTIINAPETGVYQLSINIDVCDLSNTVSLSNKIISACLKNNNTIINGSGVSTVVMPNCTSKLSNQLILRLNQNDQLTVYLLASHERLFISNRYSLFTNINTSASITIIKIK
ncbi:MAG: hypothetical protein ABIN35_00025 [candidate division WOR-3 bacterium]